MTIHIYNEEDYASMTIHIYNEEDYASVTEGILDELEDYSYGGKLVETESGELVFHTNLYRDEFGCYRIGK